MSDKTLNRLSQRFNRPTAPVVPTGRGERTPQALRGSKKRRARQSLHFADQAMSDLDDAYRKALHDSYPAQLNKAAFIEAMIATGLKYFDETVALALAQSEKEEEE